jgi:hypothetical protein
MIRRRAIDQSHDGIGGRRQAAADLEDPLRVGIPSTVQR